MQSDAGLDDPGRVRFIRETIRRKPALRAFYEGVYARYADCLARCPADGIALELGSGGGFSKEAVSGLTTSDILPYEGVDRTVDATRMPFADGELRAILMLNVFHHIADAEAFFREAVRCLRPGGRVLIVDQYPGWLSTPVYRFLHHEPFEPAAPEWKFQSEGPLSGANGALAWIVFKRDGRKFQERFPDLRLEGWRPHTPLQYWLSGGLKNWNLIPGPAIGGVERLDRALIRLSPRLASFVDVELVRR